jgi:hypothetical protein
MPTSYGLSNWIHSLPRSVWATGLCSVSAKRITSASASFAPAPHSSATVSAALSCSASARTCTAGGEAVAREAGKGLEPAERAGDRCRTSPEMQGRHTAAPQRVVNCGAGDARHRGRLAEEFAVVAALGEQPRACRRPADGFCGYAARRRAGLRGICTTAIRSSVPAEFLDGGPWWAGRMLVTLHS